MFFTESTMLNNGVIYEYMSASNPYMSPIPVLTHSYKLHSTGETRIIPFDLKDILNTKYPATSPNLLVSFIRIKKNESLSIVPNGTSHAFFIINGCGKCYIHNYDDIRWEKGDLFAIPMASEIKFESFDQDSAIYYFNDEPLMNYLNVTPHVSSFFPVMFKSKAMIQEVQHICDSDCGRKNRIGILLGNKETDILENNGTGTLTLTPILWSLLNILPANSVQKPHRHNSVALDLCVYATTNKEVYTEMGKELDKEGRVKDPIRCYWETGSVFLTPPGWWHSHHNESNEDAWVLPVQDAGLYTYQRTLNIEYA